MRLMCRDVRYLWAACGYGTGRSCRALVDEHVKREYKQRTKERVQVSRSLADSECRINAENSHSHYLTTRTRIEAVKLVAPMTWDRASREQ